MASGIRRGYLAAFLLMAAAIVVALAVRWAVAPHGPSIEIVSAPGDRRSVSLIEMRRWPVIERAGAYENRFGNWRDDGSYVGVRLSDLIGAVDYRSIVVVADDGYSLEIERDRVDDAVHPMVLAYRFDGIEVPRWTDGFRIAVLPEDGGYSNDDSCGGSWDESKPSAGSFWVRNVARIELR